MSKKQKLLLISLALLVVATIGGTSAFFVTSDRAHNVITTDGVSIDLFENTNQVGVDGRPIPFTNINNAMPGDTFSKIPQVKNTDHGDVWVRILVKNSVKNADGAVVPAPNDAITANYNAHNWLNGGDGYYYYYRALKAGETTEPLFTEVSLSKNLATTFADASFNIELTAQGVQVANNGNNVYEAEGWPEE